MSPAAGVDYLNNNFPQYLQMSREELCQEHIASALAQVFLEFSGTGTRSWYRKTVEWFLVYLITEVAVTPHNIRQGYSVPSLMDAYDAIVHELVGNAPFLVTQRKLTQINRKKGDTTLGNETRPSTSFGPILSVWTN